MPRPRSTVFSTVFNSVIFFFFSFDAGFLGGARKTLKLSENNTDPKGQTFKKVLRKKVEGR